MSDPLLARLTASLKDTAGVAAIVLGGSRARGTATEASDTDLGLYFHRERGIDTESLRRAIESVPGARIGTLTEVGEWGPWIVGGAWLSVEGRKVDLLYRPIEGVAETIAECRSGRIRMDYQPGHPHGFCSAIWMGEVALCRPLHDPGGEVARLKALTDPYPDALRVAVVGRFFCEVLFAIENAELGAKRADATHVAGSAYRALACIGQTLFALNRRYLINEKGALAEAAGLPLTISDLGERVAQIWAAIGRGGLTQACAALRRMEGELRSLVGSSNPDHDGAS